MKRIRFRLIGVAVAICTIRAVIAQDMDVEGVATVLSKETLRPLNGATVQFAKEDGDIIFSEDTKANGVVKCPGLKSNQTYSYRASKTGFSRVVVECKPDKPVNLELTRKYGP